jgi:hypothetical protein
MSELRVVMEPHAPDSLKRVVQEGLDLYTVAATGVDAYYPISIFLKGPALAKVNFLAKSAVSISSHGAMRRNGVRFALLSVGERGHQTLLLRLSILLRKALPTRGPLIPPGKCWRKITWPEF